MEKVITHNRIKTQSERWDYVLSGRILIVSEELSKEQAIGILNGRLYNFTFNNTSDLTLGENLNYSIKMKEDKIRKHLYIYEIEGKEEFTFSTDEEFELLRKYKEGKISSYDRHEGAWLEV